MRDPFQEFADWLAGLFEKPKWKYLGYASYTGTEKGKTAKQEWHVHFYENGYGQRKIEGETWIPSKIPWIRSWLEGCPMPENALYFDALKEGSKHDMKFERHEKKKEDASAK